MLRTAICLLLLLTTGASLAAATRFHEYTERFRVPKHPAPPLQASYFGGSGSEWLSGAGFLANGGLVLAGSAFGPAFDPPGVQVRVFGRDGAAPAGLPPPGKRKEDHWARPEATGFIAVLAADRRKVATCLRFAWQSASITDCLVIDDAIYVAGICGPQFATLGQGKDLTPRTDQDTSKRTGRVFIARFAADLAAPAWWATFAEQPEQSCKLHRRKDGSIMLEAGWCFALRPDGSLADWAATQIVSRYCRGIDPETFATGLGTDHNTHTGREPWRQPMLNIHRKDGTTDTLYQWDPKLVGIDSVRLVSDSSVRLIHFDPEGKLWFAGWSDGGNTVFERNPFDLRKGCEQKGLGMSAWGANASSICVIIRLDPEDGTILAKTSWLAYLALKNKPSGAGVEHFNIATDGSLIACGGTAFGTIQTGDNLHPEDDRAGGAYLAVFTPDVNDLRFCSNLLAAGVSPLRRNEDWSSGVAKVAGRHMAVVVSAAVAEQGGYCTKAYPAPMLDPVQTGYGGGIFDGHFVVLDLGPVK